MRLLTSIAAAGKGIEFVQPYRGSPAHIEPVTLTRLVLGSTGGAASSESAFSAYPYVPCQQGCQTKRVVQEAAHSTACLFPKGGLSSAWQPGIARAETIARSHQKQKSRPLQPQRPAPVTFDQPYFRGKQTRSGSGLCFGLPPRLQNLLVATIWAGEAGAPSTNKGQVAVPPTRSPGRTE